ncbi:AAA family ATPase [Brevundimonas phoenicis]|uniref:AAA family ATPase n=1 Tax=unclassified Brevundimonas TaxID=2622653 RepID=UPI0039A090FA
MRINALAVKDFRRFADLTIRCIPATVKLVVLAGPNGSGKSSLFDALLMKYKSQVGFGWSGDYKYYNRSAVQSDPGSGVTISLHGASQFRRGSLYVRSAHRNDPEFSTNSLKRQGAVLDTVTLDKLINTDATVSNNYARLASQAMEDVFVNEDNSTTMQEYRDKLIGSVRDPLQRVFPDLELAGVGNPLSEGTFFFNKGATKAFEYKNLSAGEKAAFDLILDLAIKRKDFSDAIYCIDEPEAHMNTKVQANLLQELYDLVPNESQLWIASHSIGMMRKARQIFEQDPGAVAFLDFGGRDFDNPTIIEPTPPTKEFWTSVLQVALDDLASLIAPSEVVICEGNPAGAVGGKNVEHDARVYSTIFANEKPDVTFISAGSSNQVSGDFLALATALPKVAAGMKVRRVIDLDDHAQPDVEEFQRAGITVLGRRHIESYLYDDEVLEALCVSLNKAQSISSVLAAKAIAVTNSVDVRGNPSDDVKSAAGDIYTSVKKILSLTQVGNNRHAFAQNILAPLIEPGMSVYEDLKRDIFTE